MSLSEEREELENLILGNLVQLQDKLELSKKRLELILDNMLDREPEAAIIIPEDKALESDLKELHNSVTMIKKDLDARMQDYQDLLALIEEERTGEKQ